MKKFFDKIKLFFGNVWKWALAHKAAAISIAAGFVVIVTLAIVLPITLSHSGGSKANKKKENLTIADLEQAYKTSFVDSNSFSAQLIKDGSAELCKMDKRNDNDWRFMLSTASISNYLFLSDKLDVVIEREIGEKPNYIEVDRKEYIDVFFGECCVYTIGELIGEKLNEFEFDKEEQAFKLSFEVDGKIKRKKIENPLKKCDASIYVEDGYIVKFDYTMTYELDERHTVATYSDFNKTTIKDMDYSAFYTTFDESKWNRMVRKAVYSAYDSVTVKENLNGTLTDYYYNFKDKEAFFDTAAKKEYYCVYETLPVYLSNAGGNPNNKIVTFAEINGKIDYASLVSVLELVEFDDLDEESIMFNYDTQNLKVSTRGYFYENGYEGLEIEIQGGKVVSISGTLNGTPFERKYVKYNETTIELPDFEMEDVKFSDAFLTNVVSNLYRSQIEAQEDEITHTITSIFEDDNDYVYYKKESLKPSEDDLYCLIDEDDIYHSWSYSDGEITESKDGEGNKAKDLIKTYKDALETLKINFSYTEEDNSFMFPGMSGYYEFTFNGEELIKMIDDDETTKTITFTYLDELFEIPSAVQAKIDELFE